MLKMTPVNPMDRPLERQLDDLFRIDPSLVIEQERIMFERLTAPYGESLVLFGASVLGRKTLAGLRTLGIEPLAFSDNNPTLWNRSVDGLIVLPPMDAAHKYGQKAVFVVTIYQSEKPQQQLRNLNCRCVVKFQHLYRKYHEVFLPHLCLGFPHHVIEQADEAHSGFYLFSDEASRREYLAQLRWRLWLDYEDLTLVSPYEEYFPDDLFALSADEVFVDCGAYDGDTVRRFLKRRGASFKRIFAFEPDPENLQKLQSFIAALPDAHIQEKIIVRPLAISSLKGKVRFSATGTMRSAIGNDGNMEVECAPLDELLANTIPPTFMKMDVEGAEPEALIGGRRIIEKASPAMAICVYHRYDHLWRLPLFIRSTSAHYRFFLRAHAGDGWDLVCYAIPVDRLEGH